MKVLTVISTIFIPLTFIAGVYGMNFSHEASPLNMPELYWYWGYPASLLIMALVAGVMIVYFLRRGWLPGRGSAHPNSNGEAARTAAQQSGTMSPPECSTTDQRTAR
jgi:hypothetical protein